MARKAPDPCSLERLRWASLFAAPLAKLPPPAVRIRLRQAVGVSRATVCTVLGVGFSPFIRAETGHTGERSKVLRSMGYRRILSYLIQVLALRDPVRLHQILTATEDDETGDGVCPESVQ